MELIRPLGFSEFRRKVNDPNPLDPSTVMSLYEEFIKDFKESYVDFLNRCMRK